MRSVITADLFCGAGGASTGIKLACGELGMTTLYWMMPEVFDAIREKFHLNGWVYGVAVGWRWCIETNDGTGRDNSKAFGGGLPQHGLFKTYEQAESNLLDALIHHCKLIVEGKEKML